MIHIRHVLSWTPMATQSSQSLFLAALAGAAAALAARALVRRLRVALRLHGLDKAQLLAERRRHFCAAQSISYANTDPLLIVSGHGATLVDEAGRRFLDTRNNVAHVGHAHPAVAAAVAEQVATLNTNTRYLHPNVCALAKKLLATMPAPLMVSVVVPATALGTSGAGATVARSWVLRGTLSRMRVAVPSA